MYEFVLPASAVAEVTVSVVSESVNVDPSLIVEDVPAASIRVICDFAACDAADVCNCPLLTTMSRPETDWTIINSASMNNTSLTSKSVADSTVSVVSVALKDVIVNCAVSIAFFNAELSALTTLSVPPYSKNCAAVNQYSKFKSFGFPNVASNSFSLVIVVMSSTGPFSKAPTIAPTLSTVALTTLVRSLSNTATPGESCVDAIR